jgi:Zn-finger nucleic acid-binding protein
MTTFLACPRCRDKWLSQWKNGAHALEACSTCGGVWVSHEEYGHVVQEGDLSLVTFADIAAKNHRVEVEDDGGPAACPVCKETMARTEVATVGVWIDICRSHGVWFDCSELRRVATWAEQARAKAHQDAADIAAHAPDPNRESTYNPHLHMIGSAAESVGSAMFSVIKFVAGGGRGGRDRDSDSDF